ncbi:MAG: hypothetical protein U1E65_31250 [Myxococcota bacterium]
MPDRNAALVVTATAELLRAFGRRGGHASAVLREELRRADASLRGAVVEAFYAALRNDRAIEHVLGDHTSERARAAIAGAMAGVYAWPEAARLAPGATGIDDAVVQATIEEIADPTERFAVRYSLPDPLAKRMLTGDIEDAEPLARALTAPPPITLRATQDREALIAELNDAQIPARPGRFARAAVIAEPVGSLYETSAFLEGRFELQDEGSQLIAELVAPPPSGVVLDLCAGAGGKTLAIAALLGGKGRIYATDTHRSKLTELSKRARRAELHNIQTLLITGAPDEAWPEPIARVVGKIDRVLIDAPCTGVGVLRRNPEAKWRYDAEGTRELLALQAALLRRGAPLLGPGGRLIYATCSFLPEENQRQVESILAERPELELVRPAEIWGRARADALVGASGRYLEVRPDRHGTDGFFAAVLRRKRG